MLRKLMTTILCGVFFWGGISFGRDLAGTHDNPKNAEVKEDQSITNSVTQSTYNPPLACWPLNTGRIESSLTNSGQIGAVRYYCDCDDDHCPSFVTPPGSGLEYLFVGGLWIGGIVGEDTLVTVSTDGWTAREEMFPIVEGRKFDYVGGQAVWTLAADTFTNYDYAYAHWPLNIRLSSRAYYRQTSPENNLIIYDVVITNIGEEMINEGYFGMFIDGDAYHISRSDGYCDDIVGSLPAQSVAYIIDNDGDPAPPDYDRFNELSPTKTLGAKFLRSSFAPRDSSFNWWISNGNPIYDIGPRRIDDYGNPQCSMEPAQNRGTPVLDQHKYCYLSNDEWDYDIIYATDTIEGWEPFSYPQSALDFVYCIDPRFLLSLGSFDLKPDSSVRVLFTAFTADSVHTDPNNFQDNWPDDDAYLANLNFDGVIANAELGEELIEPLLNPTNPVIGLYALYSDIDSVVIEWDPWVFEDVEGYNIYLQQVPLDIMPYPGIVPPWASPDNLSLHAQTDLTYRHNIIGLEPYRYYFISAAHQVAGGDVAMCEPILVSTGDRVPAPEPDCKFVFIQPSEPMSFAWEGPIGIDIDHYNIYEFAGWIDLMRIYSPFYDTGEAKDSIAPKDSFYVEETWYFYYAMNVAYEVDGMESSFFSAGVDDSTIYVITAVDTEGYESEFSSEIMVLHRGPRDREIAVVTYGDLRVTFAVHDTVVPYYDSVLHGYNFEIYTLKDSLRVYRDPYEWLWEDLLPFELVIWEDGLRDGIITDWPDGSMPKALEKYLWSGGTMAYFGSFGHLSGSSPYMDNPPAYKPFNHWFGQEYFGIDSVLQTDLLFYADPQFETPAAEDTLIGMILAEAAFDTIQDVAYDTDRNPFFNDFNRLWPTNTAPRVSTFIPDDRGVTTHLLRSLYPQTSIVEGHPVGVLTETDQLRTYAFGFQPWYMNHTDFRELVDYMMGNNPLDADPGIPTVPRTFSLYQNRPNPFNPNTHIEFYLPQRANVRLEIFDILGRRLRTLVKDFRESGEHVVEFDGRDDDGQSLATGIYFYRLKTDGYTKAKKMILLK